MDNLQFPYNNATSSAYRTNRAIADNAHTHSRKATVTETLADWEDRFDFPSRFIRKEICTGRIFEKIDSLSGVFFRGRLSEAGEKEIIFEQIKRGPSSHDLNNFFFPHPFCQDPEDNCHMVMLGALISIRGSGIIHPKTIGQRLHLFTDGGLDRKSIQLTLALRRIQQHYLAGPETRSDAIMRAKLALYRTEKTLAEGFPPVELGRREMTCDALADVLRKYITLMEDPQVGPMVICDPGDTIRWGLIVQRLQALALATLIGVFAGICTAQCLLFISRAS